MSVRKSHIKDACQRVRSLGGIRRVEDEFRSRGALSRSSLSIPFPPPLSPSRDLARTEFSSAPSSRFSLRVLHNSGVASGQPVTGIHAVTYYWIPYSTIASN